MSWRAFHLLASMTALASCAGTAPAPGDPAEPPMPRSICIDVQCRGDEVEAWGSEEEWRQDLVVALRDELRVGEVVFHSKAGDPPSEDADLRLNIVVEAIPPRPAAVEESAAALEILAYVTIPLLPIWIRDVRKDPGLRLELTATVLGGKGESLPKQTVPVPDLLTSYSERIPLVSWSTLGAILVPPLVFEGDERSAHMESSMGERVRRLAAAEVSKALRRQEIDPELLREIEARRDPEGWLVSFRVEPEVGRLVVRRGSRNSEPLGLRIAPLELDRVRTVPRSFELPRDFEGLVRMEATSNKTDLVRCYTLRLGDGVPRKEGSP